MKKHVISVTLIAVIVLSAISGCTTKTEQQETPPPTITIKVVEYNTDLTEIDLSFKSLTNSDIEPLKYMTNLTYLICM